ncbi:MaoC family dehydratase N-terminal domain-containing protein [Spongiactinospora gelatinilytica]|uniref:MaoC family dehydratase N-terminal domain-containing protein n=1 Tax=Spongiactinospora gelatinilytica TaxID=2666298 RepID=UPI0018F685E6|nr:MaoC family dehydratase N-terminal domain-containing protein [Spongiactinospora gelatinilytica]
MPIDPEAAKALRFAPLTVDIERGRLRFFAKATGQTDPIYHDLDAARQAGHPDLPVPPTFFFGLDLEGPDALRYLRELDVDMARVLHGEQSFVYHSLAHAGETLTVRPRIVEVFAKRGGALEFLVKRNEITRAGEPVAEATMTLVVRNPGAGG